MFENPVEVDLVHCIYTSAGTMEFNKEQIVSLLEAARKNNSTLNVTGMLLYDDGAFFQVLEGDREVVEKLFEKISKDKRHDRVTKIIVEAIEERDFSEWTMGYSGVSKEDLKKITGLNDFFSTKKCFTDLDEGRSKKLLGAFKEGQWRATLR